MTESIYEQYAFMDHFDADKCFDRHIKSDYQVNLANLILS